MRNPIEVFKERGLAGLGRSLKIRLARLVHWLVAAPLFAVHFPVCALLLPWRRIRIGLLPTERIGHLAVNPELFCRRRWLEARGGASTPILTVLVAGRPANEQLLKMWRRLLTICRSAFLHAMLRSTEALWSKSPFYQRLDIHSNEYEEFNSAPASLGFSAEEEAYGRGMLARWGVDLARDWFVCVFARDDRYLSTVYPQEGDWSYHDFRNSDIDSFGPAIEAIAAQGGFVFRMGFHAAKRLGAKSERVIDYAFEHRSDFMDIFLAAKCRFFLGTPSGIADVAIIFDRPRLGIDCVPFGFSPWGKQSLFIPKLVVDAATGTPLPFARVLQDFCDRLDPKVWDGKLALAQGYRYRENTPDEILAATREMLHRMDGTFQESAEDRELQNAYRALIPEGHWCAGVRTPMSTAFLAAHRNLLLASA